MENKHIKNIFLRLGLVIINFVPELESHDYQACRFVIAARTIIFRAAKITPTKTGQFVTLWKRHAKGPIVPLESSDAVDFVIISVQKDAHFGLFIFPKNILLEKNIISQHGQEGKRAFRVYPAWDKPKSRQALITQGWQLLYFFNLAHDKAALVDIFKLN
jgi:hypothetical protein